MYRSIDYIERKDMGNDDIIKLELQNKDNRRKDICGVILVLVLGAVLPVTVAVYGHYFGTRKVEIVREKDAY